MNPTLIGYFPKRQTSVAPSFAELGITELGSVGHYIAEGPANWMDQYRHNPMFFFDSEEVLQRVIEEAIVIDLQPDPQREPPWCVTLTREKATKFNLYAFKLFPFQFVEGRQEDFQIPDLRCEPLSEDYQRLGYDATNKSCCSHFECSPLMCNGLSSEVPVNQFCLIDEPGRAFELAKKISGSKGNYGEPGTYFVVEVWRKFPPTKEEQA
jgi:hypothetical protein